MLLDDMTATEHDLQVQSIAHGVILLEQLSPEYGAERRRLRVVKYRGRQFRGGYHDYLIRTGGLEVFPRLVAAEHRGASARREAGQSSVAELDELLGGGLERGTSTLIIGARRHRQVDARRAVRAAAAAARRERRSMFMFDESPNTLLTRCDGLGIDLEPQVEAGADRRRSRSIRPSCRRASSRTASARRSRRDGVKMVVDRQPQRLPQRDARGALPRRSSCTSC